MSAAAAAQPAPVAAVRSIREIPHACSCDWRTPDYRARPHRRAWTLPASAADPACRLHGSRDGDAS